MSSSHKNQTPIKNRHDDSTRSDQVQTFQLKNDDNEYSKNNFNGQENYERPLTENHDDSKAKNMVETPKNNKYQYQSQINNNEFLDFDPILQQLKTGILMKQSVFKNKKTSLNKNTMYQNQNINMQKFNSINIQSKFDIGDSTDTNSTLATSKRVTQLGKYGAPGLNYQNVDLFKIPDNPKFNRKQRRQKSERLNLIETFQKFASIKNENKFNLIENGPPTFLDNFENQMSRSILNEIEPEQILQDALFLATQKEQMRRNQVNINHQMMLNTARTKLGELSIKDDNLQDWRAQTQVNSFKFFGNDETKKKHHPSDVNIALKQQFNSVQRQEDSLLNQMTIQLEDKLPNLRFQQNRNDTLNSSRINASNSKLNFLYNTQIGFGMSGSFQNKFIQNESFLNDASTYNDVSPNVNQQNAQKNRSDNSFSQAFDFNSMQKYSQQFKNGIKLSPRNRSPSYKFNKSNTLYEEEKTQNQSILHMQFDELASNQLKGTYTNKFVKLNQLQRRNPLKYMKNPNKIQGVTKGIFQYIYRDNNQESKLTQFESIQQQSNFQFTPINSVNAHNKMNQTILTQFPMIGEKYQTQLQFNLNNQSNQQSLRGSPTIQNQQQKIQDNIKIHNLQKFKSQGPKGELQSQVEILTQVPQLSGRGVSISPPKDRPFVINNVIKPFVAQSEQDRLRATQILDYIIEKRRKTSKRQELELEQKKKSEEIQLVDLIKNEILKKKGGKLNQQQIDDSEIESIDKDNHFGKIMQKDLDKITGGMQTVKESNLNLDNFERIMEILPENDDTIHVGHNKMKFFMEHLQNNQYLKKYTKEYNNNIENILIQQPAYQKFDLKKRIKDKFNESPIRKAMIQVEDIQQQELSKKKKNQSPINVKESGDQSPILNIKMFNIENEQNQNQEKQYELPKVKKEMLKKDQFSKFNKRNMDKNEADQHQRNERMKNYQKSLIHLKI